MTEENKSFKQKNKHLDAWIPNSLAEWFNVYLEKYSVGKTFAEKFKSFLYKLQEQEQEGITIANPKKEAALLTPKTPEPLKTPVDLICVRGLSNATLLDPDAKEKACHFCKNLEPSQYKACQELRKEQTEAKST